MQRLENHEQPRALGYRDSIETELGDPEDERVVEEVRQEWASRGVMMSPEQLLAQQMMYEEYGARAARRLRNHEMMMNNMQANGLISYR